MTLSTQSNFSIHMYWYILFKVNVIPCFVLTVFFENTSHKGSDALDSRSMSLSREREPFGDKACDCRRGLPVKDTITFTDIRMLFSQPCVVLLITLKIITVFKSGLEKL